MQKSFYWIIGVIVIFVGLLGAAAWYKNSDTNIGDIPGFAITDKDIVRGNGPVVLMEYSDFQCPACRAYAPIVEQVLSRRAESITFVYRHFPLPQHLNAYNSAQAAEAALKQGKFWEMYVKLFENQNDWANLSSSKALDVFKGYSSELGIDVAKFEVDYKDVTIKNKIKADYKSGVNAEVVGTPSFYVDGKKLDLSGVSDVEAVIGIFTKAIDDAVIAKGGVLPLGTTTPLIKQ
jgi:protein-disulfide isomerase